MPVVAKLARIRGATPPSRNGLSHAGKHRDATMAEQLFWRLLGRLQTLQPAFGAGRRFRGLTGRFKRVIHVVDSTTIQLIASCLDWAKHRRRKAAAKCHLRLDLHSLLPRFAIVDTARDNDNARAREACAGIRAGEIVVFDRAYVASPICSGCSCAVFSGSPARRKTSGFAWSKNACAGPWARFCAATRWC